VLEPIVGRDVGGFPGTLMIICGWIPVVVVALLVQTYKKFGQKTAFVAAAAMALAFGIWEAFLSDILAVLEPIIGRDVGGFPGTLMIISGWIPVVVVALLIQRSRHIPPPPPTVERQAEPAAPIQ
jgi:uncharacterized PurR-regulated membrane protein YhhQ (DUF165 family)